MKNELIEVSFIVPTYNNENNIHQCYNDISEQNVDNFEVIFIDDCSSDKTVQKINQLQKNFNNIILIENCINNGPGKSRNLGIKVAKGKYLRFIDCDDRLPPRSTKLLLEVAKKEQHKVVRGGYLCLDENNTDLFTKKVNYNIKINIKSSSNDILLALDGHWCFLFEKKFLIDNNLYYKEEVRHAEDSFFLQNVFFVNKEIFFIDEIVYKYFLHESGSLTKEISYDTINGFQILIKNFYFICIGIGRLDLFHKRFINSFNYIYKKRFFDVFDIFSDKQKNEVISNLSKIIKISTLLSSMNEANQKLYNKNISPFYKYVLNNIDDLHYKLVCMSFHDLLKLEISYEQSAKPKKHTIVSYEDVKLYAWTGKVNFGDILSFDILDKFKISYQVSTPQSCNFITIGSILHRFLVSTNNRYSQQKLYCWGSGFISNKYDDLEHLIGKFIWEFNREIEFLALRGKYTQTIVEKILNKKLYIPLGDPGLLVSRFIPKNVHKKYDVGIVLHWKDNEKDLQNKIQCKRYSIKFISVSRAPEVVINEIQQCKCILSSSLHGLIVADSFSIPNRFIQVSQKTEGGDFKFRDYYSAFKARPFKKFIASENIIDDTTIERIIENYNIDKYEIEHICHNLLKNFPRHLMCFDNIFYKFISKFVNPISLLY